MASPEPQHAETLAALRDLQQHQLFTDFTLQLKDGPVHVSRNLLAAMSPVFRTMLSTDMTESRNSTVNMPHITMETWTCIMQFYFTSQKLVSMENVKDIIEASHMYGLDRLKEYCSDFLISTCSPDNCLSVRRMAAKFELESLAKAATCVLVENFSEVCKCEEFLSLEKAEILKVLEEEELVTTEDNLCQALLAWMENNNTDEDTCTKLFQHVRLEKVSDLCLGTHFLYLEVLSHSLSLQAAVQQEVRRRTQRPQYRQDQSAPLRRRRRGITTRSLLAVGSNRERKICLLQWPFEERRWMWRGNLNWQFSTVRFIAVCQSTVFITGGNGTFQYDTETRTKTAGPHLMEEREHHGMAVIKDKVYVVAGSNRNYVSSSIMEYSQASGRWTDSGNLRGATKNCGVTALGDTILVVGGDPGESAQLIQTFNVETRTAAVLHVRLPRPMRYVRAASLGSTAFFVGSEGDLVQIREVDGTFQMTSYALLQGFGRETTQFGLHVTDSCVRVIERGSSKSFKCWNYQGEKIQNDEVEDPPEEMTVYALLETDIPRL